jgi:ribonuclease D
VSPQPDHFIQTPAALADVVARFRRAPLVAADTEAASFHRYRDRIYLIQLAAGAETAVVDPLAVADLGPIGALLADPQVEKIFHDADYDLRILDRDYGFHAKHLFDTRIAAQLVGEPAIGLASLLEKYAGVKLSKAHQKADWSQRPLPPAMLEYAAADTRHLPELRAALRARLEQLGRLAWAEEEFVRLEGLRWTGPGEDDTDAYLRVKSAKTLAPRQLAALRELFNWRESIAEKEDKAPFRVVGPDVLLGVAKALPDSPDALSRLREVPSSLARRYGPALLDAVRRASAIPERDLPQLERIRRAPKDPGFDDAIERLKAARTRVAEKLGLDPGVLCGRTTLEAVARAKPANRAGLLQVPELRRWQVEVLGDDLLAALKPPS